MALTKPLKIVPPKTKPGSWKDSMPGRITKEAAEAEPKARRLFPE